MLAALPLFFLGCAKTVTLYPITDKDIKCDTDGCWVSSFYMEEIMKVRIKNG
jgi:hypothetical protein